MAQISEMSTEIRKKIELSAYEEVRILVAIDTDDRAKRDLIEDLVDKFLDEVEKINGAKNHTF